MDDFQNTCDIPEIRKVALQFGPVLLMDPDVLEMALDSTLQSFKTPATKLNSLSLRD
jgi:hypothetical protein